MKTQVSSSQMEKHFAGSKWELVATEDGATMVLFSPSEQPLAFRAPTDLELKQAGLTPAGPLVVA
jgi:hypothetical protein